MKNIFSDNEFDARLSRIYRLDQYQQGVAFHALKRNYQAWGDILRIIYREIHAELEPEDDKDVTSLFEKFYNKMSELNNLKMASFRNPIIAQDTSKEEREIYLLLDAIDLKINKLLKKAGLYPRWKSNKPDGSLEIGDKEDILVLDEPL